MSAAPMFDAVLATLALVCLAGVGLAIILTR